MADDRSHRPRWSGISLGLCVTTAGDSAHFTASFTAVQRASRAELCLGDSLVLPVCGEEVIVTLTLRPTLTPGRCAFCDLLGMTTTTSPRRNGHLTPVVVC